LVGSDYPWLTMPNEPFRRDPISGDPYRILGLEPGASMAEVKRAYRQLAKAFHPDSAGPSALPRFLAIHAAYEQLLTGRTLPGRVAPAPASREPWRADPARARAARDRAARGGSRRWSSASSATGSQGPAGWGSRTAPPGGRPGAEAGSAPGGAAAGPTEGRGRRRYVRKATLGSTSYDEARDATDRTWTGASWYGPTSGEYWTVNPREYADPRKHGPAYQARLRRERAEAMTDREADASGEPIAGERVGRPPGPRSDPRRASRSERAATRTQETAASAPPEVVAAAADETAAQASGPQAPAPPAPAPPPSVRATAAMDAAAPETTIRRSLAWLTVPNEDPVRRLGIALVAWPPLGIAAAIGLGAATGCASFSAACGTSEQILPWLAQGAILGLLLVLPAAARWLAAGTIGLLLGLIPFTALLVALGGAGRPEAAAVLVGLLVISWLGGVAWALRGGPSDEQPGGQRSAGA
jgi:DnaJ domain